ncbi:MAG: serine/threonine protein kinase [Actinobacteria bacterium]|nr:serine/threonine protein kinase [Actinomycetota bacterium]
MGEITQADVMAGEDADAFIGATVNFTGASYLIRASLGLGGTSELFLAESGKGHVAVKLLASSLAHDTVSRERFLREAELLCRLCSPYLVYGYAVGFWHESPFIVMENIVGRSLSKELEHVDKLPVARSLAITRDVLSALNHLYLDGRVTAHRDIKPSNILLTDTGCTKLIDLGIAKTPIHVRSELDTMFLGSIHYVSPEQIQDSSRVDMRSDIYSLGAVFYEMCAGKRAYSGSTSREVLAAHLVGTIPTFEKSGEFADNDDLLNICNKILQYTLAPDYLNRFQTPSKFFELLDEAEAYLGNGVLAHSMKANAGHIKGHPDAVRNKFRRVILAVLLGLCICLGALVLTNRTIELDMIDTTTTIAPPKGDRIRP